LKCRETFARVWDLFEPPSQLLLLLVVIRNVPIARFVEQAGVGPNLAKELLLAALDRLVDWFDCPARCRSDIGALTWARYRSLAVIAKNVVPVKPRDGWLAGESGVRAMEIIEVLP